MDLDDLQEDLKGISRYQWAVLTAIVINLTPTAFTGNSGAFLSASPEHRCIITRI